MKSQIVDEIEQSSKSDQIADGVIKEFSNKNQIPSKEENEELTNIFPNLNEIQKELCDMMQTEFDDLAYKLEECSKDILAISDINDVAGLEKLEKTIEVDRENFLSCNNNYDYLPSLCIRMGKHDEKIQDIKKREQLMNEFGKIIEEETIDAKKKIEAAIEEFIKKTQEL